MSDRRRPDIKLFAKRKAAGEGPEYVDLGAFWREDGRLGGGFDKRIRGLTVHLEDGTRVRVAVADYYLNLREEGSAPRAQGGPRDAPSGRRPAPPPVDPIDSDDIPF